MFNNTVLYMIVLLTVFILTVFIMGGFRWPSMNDVWKFLLGLILGLSVASAIYTVNIASLHEQVSVLKDDYSELLDRQQELENAP